MITLGGTVTLLSGKLAGSLKDHTILGRSLTRQTFRAVGSFLIIASLLFAIFTLPGTRYGRSLQGSSNFSRFLETGSNDLFRKALSHWQAAGDANSFTRAMSLIPPESPVWKYYIGASAHFFFDMENPEGYLDYLHSIAKQLDHPMGLAAVHFELGNIYLQFDPSKAREHFLLVTKQQADEELTGRAAGNINELDNLNIGQTPPAFSLTTLDGKEINSKEFYGKIVLLDFWAVSCPPCLRQIVKKRELFNTIQSKEFIMISVALQDDPETRTFLQNNPLSWPQVLASPKQPSDIIRIFNLQYVPNLYILDKQGRIAHKRLPADRLLGVIQQLLDKG